MSFAITAALFFGLPTFLFTKPIPYHRSPKPSQPVYVRGCCIAQISCGRSEGDEGTSESSSVVDESVRSRKNDNKKKIVGTSSKTFRCYRHRYAARKYNPTDEYPRGTRFRASSRNGYSSRAVPARCGLLMTLRAAPPPYTFYPVHIYYSHTHTHTAAFMHTRIFPWVYGGVCERSRFVQK